VNTNMNTNPMIRLLAVATIASVMSLATLSSADAQDGQDGIATDTEMERSEIEIAEPLTVVAADQGTPMPPLPAMAPGTKFEIKNEESGQCLGIALNAEESGAAVIHVPCNGANDAQAWRFAALADGTPNTYNIKNVNSNLCITVAGGGNSNWLVVRQRGCQDDHAKNFRPEFIGFGAPGTVGRFQLMRATGSNRCLDNGDTSARGAPVVQYGCFGAGTDGLDSRQVYVLKVR